MMKKYIKYALVMLLGTWVWMSCNDEDVTAPGKYSIAEAPASGTLKALAQAHGLKIGNTLQYADLNDPQKLALIKSEFDNVTCEYEMKHGAIVQNDGTFHWTKADAMVEWTKANGLALYGHTLVWHKNQNATYLNSLAGGGSGEKYANRLPSGDFESGLDGWVKANVGLGIDLTSESVHKGTYAVKLVSDPQHNTEWRLQLKAPAVKMTPGHLVRIEFWARCVGGGGNVRISTGDAKQLISTDTDADRQYLPGFEITDSWQKYTYETVYDETLTVGESGDVQVVFDMGKVGGKTYYLDDVVINDLSPRVDNGDFEAGNMDGWVKANVGLGIDLTSESVHKGTYAVKLVSDPQHNTEWRLQLKAPAVKMTPGHLVRIEFWTRCVGGGGNIRISTGGAKQLIGTDTDSDRQYLPGFEITDSWQKYTYETVYDETLTVGESGDVQIVFDMGKVGGKTYYLDDVYIYDTTEGEGSSGNDIEDPEAVRQAIDNSMRAWISAMVGKYKNDVHAWDVVNEPMAEGKSGLRTRANSDSEGSDIFFWSDFMGRDYALKAFQYAEAADPEALLFINEYNLESNPAKLDSLIAYVAELKEKGAKIDGIGTQMHIYDPKYYAPIREMFQKLAATGLLIKITELDVKANAGGNETLTAIDAEYQAAMYGYIVKSYLEIVPKAQQYGITIWGINDGSSWIKPSGEKAFFPLPWHDNLERKPAYHAVYKALE